VVTEASEIGAERTVWNLLENLGSSLARGWNNVRIIVHSEGICVKNVNSSTMSGAGLAEFQVLHERNFLKGSE
jgi:hypothetical protein